MMFSDEKIIELARKAEIWGQTVTTQGLARFSELVAQELAPVSVESEAVTVEDCQLGEALNAIEHGNHIGDVSKMVEPYGYFRPEPFGWTDCAETDEGAIALYERPCQCAA